MVPVELLCKGYVPWKHWSDVYRDGNRGHHAIKSHSFSIPAISQVPKRVGLTSAFFVAAMMSWEREKKREKPSRFVVGDYCKPGRVRSSSPAPLPPPSTHLGRSAAICFHFLDVSWARSAETQRSLDSPSLRQLLIGGLLSKEKNISVPRRGETLPGAPI